MQAGNLSAEVIAACEDQLAVCEGSDWFWWLGDYNAAASISSFDSLFRRNLSNLYLLLKLPVPSNLCHAINMDNMKLDSSDITSVMASGTMKRGKES